MKTYWVREGYDTTGCGTCGNSACRAKDPTRMGHYFVMPDDFQVAATACSQDCVLPTAIQLVQRQLRSTQKLFRVVLYRPRVTTHRDVYGASDPLLREQRIIGNDQMHTYDCDQDVGERYYNRPKCSCGWVGPVCHRTTAFEIEWRDKHLGDVAKQKGVHEIPGR